MRNITLCKVGICLAYRFFNVGRFTRLIGGAGCDGGEGDLVGPTIRGKISRDKREESKDKKGLQHSMGSRKIRRNIKREKEKIGQDR